MPWPFYLTLLFLCCLITFALAYKYGKKNYQFENIGCPLTLKDIIKVHGLDLLCKELATLYCIKSKLGYFLCLAKDQETEKIYYFKFNNHPGKFFIFYVQEKMPKQFEIILTTNS
ncbi:MAG: hypothetical protein Q7K65_05685 [Candidatus Buchananbacteria bacterium]|nr:hypothetical protein [Candidatus Buchananbacteria bacterium]